MFTIRLKTFRYRPDLQVTIRSNAQNWQEDLAGNYEKDEWVFHLDEDQYQQGMFFKFVLEKQYWMQGGNLYLTPEAGKDYAFDGGQVQFPVVDEVLVENGYVSQRFFEPNPDENHLYDLIVIGSGVGGGIVAEQAADLGLDVLVLELGSYLFPTHVGNLPRQHQLAPWVDKNIWGFWDDFKVTNYTNTPGSQYQGGQGFNLGGRSIFWGGLIPRMSWWELDSWPQDVKWYLEDQGYELAEQLLKKSQLDSAYQSEIKSFLRNQFHDFVVLNAPMAIQHTSPELRSVPAGVFSTADLLMESRLTESAKGMQGLTINLNHAVTKIETQDNRATGVVAYDLIADKARTYQGKAIVLAAGSVESPKIALLSGLKDPTQQIGKGFSDHPIFYTHFALPANSPFYRSDAAAKILLRNSDANATQHRYNIVLELGTDFNQGRFIDPEILAKQQIVKGNSMLCEIVFLFHAPLVEQNTLAQQGPSYVKPNVTMQECPIDGAEWNEINAFKDAIIQQLGGEVLQNGNLALNRAGLGGVAHEVGSLRMGTGGSAVVDPNLKFSGYDNLFVCDLSVFPTSPAANPTLTLAALALRLAGHLKTQLSA